MYGDAAAYYDILTSDIDYGGYAMYFNDIFKTHMDRIPESIMDLGCGTGSLTLRLAGMGYDMTGVDASPGMLGEAYAKGGPGILWINQDFTEIDLFGTYDAAVSLLDCVNHLRDEREVEKYFRLVHNYLNPGGLFVFDINSEYKFREVFSSNVFYSVNDDFAYIWQNEYNLEKRTCVMEITIFIRENGLYRRIDTCNTERAFATGEMKNLLEKAGFCIISVYNDLTFDEPGDKAERIFFVCRKEV
ncbi:MAG: class I SAM-dependent methyltransferase [Clostridia bacterium]|nr:class I SAM-dependent methyltransferase [Clostridia bacterium]